MTDDRQQPSPPTTGLASYIRQHKEEILADWETSIRELPIARELSRFALRDHLPELLSRIAEMAETGRDPSQGRPSVQPSVAHALDRLEVGYDLGEVVTEYAVLRECVLRHWEERGVPAIHPSELRVLNRAIDYAIETSVQRFTSARDRTLQALDRISAAALGSTNLDAFLPALLLVLKETTPAIDWAEIFLVEDGRLVVRATVGLEEDAAHAFSVAIGEGFAGVIASSRAPQLSHAAGQDPRVMSRAIRAAGTRAMFGVPMVRNGDVIGVAQIGSRTASDFSDEDKLLLNVMATRASAMLEQHRLREEAESRAADAQRATRARDEVLAIVSHDLRNPLSALMTAASLLAQGLGDAAGVKRKTAVIQRSAARMARLIEDLLDVSVIDSGGLVLELQPQPLAPLVSEALELQKPLADEKSVTLAADLESALPEVQVDRERLRRVFANLLGNAIKFTPAGGSITVRAERAGARVCVSVVDTGTGIDPEHLPRIFDRFWQTRDTKHGGAGLGLAIVKGIVEAHGGEIRAESCPNEGSTFSFSLPVATP